MKALVCAELNSLESLTIKEVPSPTPLPEEVLINVHACGISFPDLLILQNKYQFKPTLPFSPGGEVSGIISGIGEHVTQFKVGDRVIGLNKWGGLAEQVVIKSKQVFRLPKSVDFITGASTLYAYGTSYHALKDRAQIKPGETLLVLGASGGVGLAAVELGKIMGAKIIAAASTEEKLKACRGKGADHLINYGQEDLRSEIKTITNERGIDVIYDAVGGRFSEPALRSMTWGGRYLVVGFASGEIPSFPANIPLLKGCSIVGVFFSGFMDRNPETSNQNFNQLAIWMEKGKIKQPIHRIYSFNESLSALQDLRDRKIVGKAVIKIA